MNEAHLDGHRVRLERRAASWYLGTQIPSLELHVADGTIVAHVWTECRVHGWWVLLEATRDLEEVVGVFRNEGAGTLATCPNLGD